MDEHTFARQARKSQVINYKRSEIEVEEVDNYHVTQINDASSMPSSEYFSSFASKLSRTNTNQKDVDTLKTLLSDNCIKVHELQNENSYLKKQLEFKDQHILKLNSSGGTVSNDRANGPFDSRTSIISNGRVSIVSQCDGCHVLLTTQRQHQNLQNLYNELQEKLTSQSQILMNYRMQTESLSRENRMLLASTKLFLDLKDRLKRSKEVSDWSELALISQECYKKVSSHLKMLKRSSKQQNQPEDDNNNLENEEDDDLPSHYKQILLEKVADKMSISVSKIDDVLQVVNEDIEDNDQEIEKRLDGEIIEDQEELPF